MLHVQDENRISLMLSNISSGQKINSEKNGNGMLDIIIQASIMILLHTIRWMIGRTVKVDDVGNSRLISASVL